MSNSINFESRSVHHKHLRYISLVAVIILIVGVLTLFPYSLATVSCWGSAPDGFGLCEVFSSLPWIGFVLSLGAYLFVVWIIHELGRDNISIEDRAKVSRYARMYAMRGYKELDKGHHHLVRRVHRIASVALAGLAAWISFWHFGGDTLVNIGVAVIVYAVIGELFNWKTFDRLMKETSVK